MAIKVSVGEPKTQEVKPFPKLMRNQDGDVFFMVRHKYGLPLTGEDWNYKQKDFADFINNDYHIFEDLNDEITLQNE